MRKVLILDRDGVLNHSSDSPESSLYYITSLEDLTLKPSVRYTLNSIRDKCDLVLATKQRCISKGLVTREKVDQINNHLQYVIGVKFDKVLVEEFAEDKRQLFLEIIDSYTDSQLFLLDNSIKECSVAESLGISTLCSTHIRDIYKWEKFWS